MCLSQVESERDALRQKWFTSDGRVHPCSPAVGPLPVASMSQLSQALASTTLPNSASSREVGGSGAAWLSTPGGGEPSLPSDLGLPLGTVRIPDSPPASWTAAANVGSTPSGHIPHHPPADRGGSDVAKAEGSRLGLDGLTARSVEQGGGQADAFGSRIGSSLARPFRSSAFVLSRPIERSILEAKREFEYALQRGGVPEPWLLMERLGDEILDDILHECADHLFRVCDEAVDKVAEDEFQRDV